MRAGADARREGHEHLRTIRRGGPFAVADLLPLWAFRRGGPFAVTGSGARWRIGRGVRGRIRGADGSGSGSGGGSVRGRICK